MDAPTTITIETRGDIEILTLNRPPLNLVNPAMITELTAYFSGLYHRPEVRVVIMRGAGRAFCAGAELNSDAFVPRGGGRPKLQLEMQKHYSGVIRLMRGCPQPIIALLHGAAAGAGFSLMLATDVRYAAPDVRMSAAYIRVGLGGCDMGSGYLLPRLVGLSAASEFLMSGRAITAERALRMNLVSEIVPDKDLLDAGLALAADMLRAAPLGLRMTKDTLNMSIDAPSLEAGLMIEDRQQVMLLETDDHLEAVSAFKEKRRPNYADR